MDIEKTLATIVEQQRKTDKRVDALAKLVQLGMKNLVALGKAQTET